MERPAAARTNAGRMGAGSQSSPAVRGERDRTSLRIAGLCVVDRLPVRRATATVARGGVTIADVVEFLRIAWTGDVPTGDARGRRLRPQVRAASLPAIHGQLDVGRVVPGERYGTPGAFVDGRLRLSLRLAEIHVRVARERTGVHNVLVRRVHL